MTFFRKTVPNFTVLLYQLKCNNHVYVGSDRIVNTKKRKPEKGMFKLVSKYSTRILIYQYKICGEVGIQFET